MEKSIDAYINAYIDEQANWGVGYFSMKTEKTKKQVVSKDSNKCSNLSSEKQRGNTELNNLYEKIRNCRKCPLGKTRLNFVFGVGNPSSPLMFVGEGPGYDEDRQGEPFVGRAGQLLNKIIEAMKLKREDVYITNITKCHPMIDPTNPEKRGNDRPPTKEEMEKCMSYLEKQIEIIGPKVICALGNTATQGLLDTEETIGNLRGRVIELKIKSLNIKMVPTYHPAALLRNPALKKYTWEDIKLVMKLLNEI